jgi:hypothetical protein
MEVPAVASKRRKKGRAKKTGVTVVEMRLYVAGRAPNSVKAISNLEAICQKHFKDGYAWRSSTSASIRGAHSTTAFS